MINLFFIGKVKVQIAKVKFHASFQINTLYIKNKQNANRSKILIITCKYCQTITDIKYKVF